MNKVEQNNNMQDMTQVALADQHLMNICKEILSTNLENKDLNLFKISSEVPAFRKQNLVLFRIDEITFEEDAPRLEALENVISCMSIPGVNFVYLILGDKNDGKVNFYFGFCKDSLAKEQITDSVLELGRAFIKPAIEGNFRGSVLSEVKGEQIDQIHTRISQFIQSNSKILSGVPGWVKDKEMQDFRGIDRLVDVMQGDDFCFMIIAKPIQNLNMLREDIHKTYDLLSAMSKHSVQLGFNKGTNSSISVNTGLSINTGRSDGKTQTKQRGTNTNKESRSSSGDGDYSTSKSHGTSDSYSQAKSITINEGKTESKGETKGSGESQGTSVTISYDNTNKSAADWVKYFDDVLLPRLDYARGKGAFVVNTVLCGENPQVVSKLSNVARSIFAGETANMVPLVPRNLPTNASSHLSSFSIPYGYADDKINEQLCFIRAGLLGYGEENLGFSHHLLYNGNWMSARELALMSGLPRKEVLGVRLKKEIEFGLNIPSTDKETFPLGQLIKSGLPCKGGQVFLEKSQLDRHIFVAGVTGSGKTTTCQTLLLESEWPFLVIEPAKTEYRGLLAKPSPDKKAICPDLMVFTLGDDTVAPFRMNPFEFLPGESITSRVDMLMASITSAFDMEAAIPQLIERAIYACYEDYGWNIKDNQNKYYREYKEGNNYEGTAFEDGTFAFPTLSDVLDKVVAVVDEQGFDDRLKKDYIGSIKGRLQGLTLGAKGLMLNCQRSIDFEDLLNKKVVLELEPIANPAQKSLIIGIVLTNLLQAIKKKFKDAGSRKVKHITLIEEAHRLLTRADQGSSPSQRQASETFADMLAEIRKYGESLIIADQIPNKLTPEVIKNTNTKIVHRLFAQDDKEAVAHTMDLDEDQASFLSNLPPGRAIVFNGKWPKAVQVQITEKYNTGSETPPLDNQLHQIALAYYTSHYKRGVYGCTELIPKLPKNTDQAKDLIKKIVDLSEALPDDFSYLLQRSVQPPDRAKLCNLCSLIKILGVEVVAKGLFARVYYTINTQLLEELECIFHDLLDENKELPFKELQRFRISAKGQKSIWKK